MTMPTEELARQLAIDSIRATTAAGSGHPTSAMSAADLMAVLITSHFRFDLDSPDNPANDRFVLSKGHGAPLLYAALKALGAIDDAELLRLRTADSPLQGHPVPGLPLIDVATGSLGLGLSNGLGMALGLRRLDSPARVWVLLGDSEMTEGSVWEAMALASHHKAANLIALLDMNRLGQTGATMYGWNSDLYRDRARAFGWIVLETNGHDHEQLDRALTEAESHGPALVIARTVKGNGVSFLADQNGWHGKALDKEQEASAIEELGVGEEIRVTPAVPVVFDRLEQPQEATAEDVSFDQPIATRKAFGQALAAEAAANGRLIVLDGEVSNSTMTEEVMKSAPDQFLQMYIAEQAMLGAAVGLDAVGFVPVVATFGAFLSRAHDVLRMAAIGGASLVVCGSHAGVSIGEDGPSQMALEDMAMMRALPGTTVLYPADGNAAVALLKAGLAQPGITYLRTTRADTPRLYGPGERFVVGGSHTLRSSAEDGVTVISAGITLFEALEAADSLEKEGIPIRVIDAYSVEPLDRAEIRQAAIQTGHLVVVEDHRRVGGLGDAVLAAVADLPACTVDKLGVEGVPGSSDPKSQLRAAAISAADIVEAVQKAVA
jgi:transketolase